MSKGIRVMVNVFLQDPKTQGRDARWDTPQDVNWIGSKPVLRFLQ